MRIGTLGLALLCLSVSLASAQDGYFLYELKTQPHCSPSRSELLRSQAQDERLAQAAGVDPRECWSYNYPALLGERAVAQFQVPPERPAADAERIAELVDQVTRLAAQVESLQGKLRAAEVARGDEFPNANDWQRHDVDTAMQGGGRLMLDPQTGTGPWWYTTEWVVTNIGGGKQWNLARHRGKLLPLTAVWGDAGSTPAQQNSSSSGGSSGANNGGGGAGGGGNPNGQGGFQIPNLYIPPQRGLGQFSVPEEDAEKFVVTLPVQASAIEHREYRHGQGLQYQVLVTDANGPRKLTRVTERTWRIDDVRAGHLLTFIWGRTGPGEYEYRKAYRVLEAKPSELRVVLAR